ncbi:Bifunctional inhibitor/plant lipid transfer protein/seed storage helical domain superfamily [Arabidopsis thaliana x Arabidopsis arenosa]|uniref:Bifunctional inhibitor/plant lipid transfer protein/seed storage helical domain superfamily n=1 Tax=Arabidopsis thaliana x Arabidopsis arenosa TaxID=1240361 RepID=A0A8T2BHB6_9BRAS|nr:Bifunctional inhibitor/plant lipid transfer protein/seed storage helical domain superfamily [Arabidopsis thaliana x Arabidopsis arenosa]
MKTMMIFAAAMTVMALVSVPAVEAQTECVSKLVPCFNDLNTTTTPVKECCDSIKEAVEKELTCLCTIYTTPGLLSQFNVTTDKALSLSRRCNVTTDLSACTAKGAPSPKAALPPPAGNTKKDAGAGNKLAGYGVTTVILSLISSIFF